MFEDALFESTAALRQSTASRWPTIISIAFQSLIVAALLAIPLLHPAVIVAMPHRLDLLPPPPPKAPTPPPQPPRAHVIPTVMSATSMPTPAPEAARSTPSLQPTAPDGPPSLTAINLTGTGIALSGLPIGLGPATSNSRISVGTGTGSTTFTGPHAISTGVSAGLLLEPIRPVYPTIARLSHQQGIVTVEALISTAGRIESAHATSGPITLQTAAVDAVRQARYKPYMLNGQPTEVSATFTIHFTLNE